MRLAGVRDDSRIFRRSVTRSPRRNGPMERKMSGTPWIRIHRWPSRKGEMEFCSSAGAKDAACWRSAQPCVSGSPTCSIMRARRHRSPVKPLRREPVVMRMLDGLARRIAESQAAIVGCHTFWMHWRREWYRCRTIRNMLQRRFSSTKFSNKNARSRHRSKTKRRRDFMNG